MTTKSQVEIVEVGPRDGLQNEKTLFPTEQKLAMINDLISAGARRIEVASFVHPKLVPQMADAEAVIAGLDNNPDVTYIGLVLNKRGLLRAMETRENGARGVDEVGCVAVASDGFGKANQGQTSAESVEVCGDIIKLAKSEGLRAQATISVCFGCPFDGEIDPNHVTDMVKRLSDFEPLEIAIADTIGVGVPSRVRDVIGASVEAANGIPIRAHFHDTRGTGIANAYAAFESGASVLDASLGGLGGCPFAPGATGNIATEDLVYLLDRSGISHGINLEQLIIASRKVSDFMGQTLPSSLARAGGFPKPA